MMDLAAAYLPTLLSTLIGATGGGFAAYVAIRADLAHMKATVAILQESVQRAHVRIDDHVQRQHTR